MKWRRIAEGGLEDFYREVLPAIREAAKGCGYGIAAHGSMRRDLDLMAMPWVEDHASADALAQAIQMAACGITSAVVWERKPCGRIAASMAICMTEADFRPSAGHIDLSVMPGGEVNHGKTF